MTRRDFVSRIACAASALIPPLGASCTFKVEPPTRVGAIVWPGYECLFLARELGFLDQVPIKLVEYHTAPEAIRNFLNGALEVVAVTGDEFLRIAAVEPSARAFLVTDFSNGADALLARPGIDCVTKLAGRKVGVQVNATGVFILTRALASAEMTARDIQIVPVDTDQQVGAFERGEVDAVITFDPHRTKILKMGGQALFDTSSIPYEQSDFLVARAETLREHAGRIESLTRAWFQARDFLKREPRRASEMISPREGITPEDFLKSLQLLALPSLEENRQLLSNPESDLMTGLRRVHEVLRDHGKLAVVEPKIEMLTTGALR